METFNKITKLLLSFTTTTYVFIMVGIFPLYYDDKYYNMGEAKYLFVKYLSLGAFLLLLIILSIYLVGNIIAQIGKWLPNVDAKASEQNKKEIKTQTNKQMTNQIKTQIKLQISLVDWFVIAYAVVVTISYLLTPYKETGLWGYAGWYMGLMSQWLFVLIYFFVSRFIKGKKLIVIVALVCSFIVFFLAILQRFQIDPLDMYENLGMNTKVQFLTTIGQATWYSSYLCIVFPIGLFLFWNSQKLYHRLILGIYVIIGFGTIVTQNSDSAFFATSIILSVLFCFSFSNFRKFKQFIEVLLLALLAFKFIGIFQILFPAVIVPLDTLSIFFSQSRLMFIALIVIAVIYLALILSEERRKLENNKRMILNWQIIPKVCIILLLLMLPVIIILIYATTTKQLPQFLDFFYDINYFTFDDSWGNGRGFTWKISAQIFQEYPLVNKLFGCGPDCFVDYSYARYQTVLDSMWKGNFLTNAHNEWFTSLLFFGITGFMAYTGIFITQAVLCMRESRHNPFLIAIAICILSYMGHNFFCYQQIVCTPLIFIVIGIGESMRREIKVKKQE